MQNDKKIVEGAEIFLMPSEVLRVAGFVDSDKLLITASRGKIIIKSLGDMELECDGDCKNCPINEEECDGDCNSCPCFENCVER